MGLHLRSWGLDRPRRPVGLMIGVAILAAMHEPNVRWPSLFSLQNKDTRVDDNLLKPTRVEWDKLADRFSKYDGELEVM
jgi:hypothetical protein